MMEVRIHGRGGQGIKKTAQILGRAAYLSGFFTQDFAMYGAERRGAPVTSFVRYDKKPISSRGYVFEPDFIVIIDSTLEMENMLKGMKKNTLVIINTKAKPNIKGAHWIDAMKISIQSTGKPIPNTVMLGAFAKLAEIDIKHMCDAIKKELEKYSDEIVEKNIIACKKGYEMVS